MRDSAIIQGIQRTMMAALYFFVLGGTSVMAETYYVDALNGEDAHNSVEARNPATPWQTLEHAAAHPHVQAGDTIIVKPGVYTQTIKPRDDNMTWRSEPRWGAILDPTIDEAVKVDGRTGTIIEGFAIQGGTTAVRYEDATGGAIRNNVIYGALFQGITLEDSYDIVVEGNRIFSNGAAGVKGTRGTGLVIKGNLVYANTDQGISLEGQGSTSPGNRIEGNTVDKNGLGGIRLTGPVGQTQIVSNIVSRNGTAVGGIGIKIPSHCCPPIVFEDYNNSWGNGNDPEDNFDLPSDTVPNDHDISQNPLHVDPDGADNVLGGAGWTDDNYYLAHVATGQPSNSPSIDAGDPTLLVEGTTATDNFLDEGLPDQGFHYPAHTTPMQSLTLHKARSTFREEGEKFLISSRLVGAFELGAGNNGGNLANERIRIELDTFVQTLPAGSCDRLQTNLWRCKGTTPGVTSMTIDFKKGTFIMNTEDIPAIVSPLPSSIRLNLHMGDDLGSTETSYTTGIVSFPK